MTDRLLLLAVATKNRVSGVDRERGDVPGWVMITLMTAGIVAVLWGVAQGALTKLFNDAISSARSGGGGGTSG